MKKFFWIRGYKFQKCLMKDRLKYTTKYYLTIRLFGFDINFRIMNQDNSFFFRCETFNNWLHKIKTKNNTELPF